MVRAMQPLKRAGTAPPRGHIPEARPPPLHLIHWNISHGLTLAKPHMGEYLFAIHVIYVAI